MVMAKPNYFMGIEGGGFSVFTIGRPSKRYPAGRRCSVLNCLTVLSVYNKHDTCWAHLDDSEYLGPIRVRRRQKDAVVT